MFAGEGHAEEIKCTVATDAAESEKDILVNVDFIKLKVDNATQRFETDIKTLSVQPNTMADIQGTQPKNGDKSTTMGEPETLDSRRTSTSANQSPTSSTVYYYDDAAEYARAVNDTP